MTPNSTAANRRFRLLVVDNEDAFPDLVVASATGLDIDIWHVDSRDRALEFFRNRVVDHIFLDLFLDEVTPGGLQVVRDLAARGASCDITLVTKGDLAEAADRIVETSTRTDRPRVVNLIKKHDDLETIVPRYLGGLTEKFRSELIEIEGLEQTASFVARRADRYPRATESRPLRTDVSEIEAELIRLISGLFRGAKASQETNVSVTLRPLERRGLSAAVMVRPKVRVKIAGAPDALATDAFDCVLKLGPVDDMLAEASRYIEYVRFGVKLEQRVEMLSHAVRDAIGGIVYSFAGGTYDEDLKTLDELLTEESELASDVLGNLFETVSWYGVRGADRVIRNHMTSSFNVDLDNLLDKVHEGLEPLAKSQQNVSCSFDRDRNKGLNVKIGDSCKLPLPGRGFLRGDWALVRRPQCLIHGDMHGGNILAQIMVDALSVTSRPNRRIDRVCLIDYRNAGPGPRCLDASALEATIRVSDAQLLARKYMESGSLTKGSVAEYDAMLEAARRVDQERQLLDHLWRGRDSAPRGRWAELSITVVEGMKRSFSDPDIDPIEFLQTNVWYGLRQLTHPVGRVTRVRICAWLSANYQLLDKLLRVEARPNV